MSARRERRRSADSRNASLQAFLFCDAVDRDPDTNVRRIIRDLIVAAQLPAIASTHLYVRIASREPGRHTFRLVTHSPTGQVSRSDLVNIDIGHQDGSGNHEGPFVLQVDAWGTYWIELELDGKVITSAPLVIRHGIAASDGRQVH